MSILLAYRGSRLLCSASRLSSLYLYSGPTVRLVRREETWKYSALSFRTSSHSEKRNDERRWRTRVANRLRDASKRQITRLRNTRVANRLRDASKRQISRLRNRGRSLVVKAKEASRRRVRRVRRRVDQGKEKLREAGEGMTRRLYRTMKNYGPVGLGVYLTIGTLDWAIFYLLIRWGVDMDSLLSIIGVKHLTSTAGTTTMATVGVAYACHKVILPLRLMLTVAATRPLVRRLVKAGWMKPRKMD